MSEERKTTKHTEVCISCGLVFIDADDYDTLGSKCGLCCPVCGVEKFVSVKTIIEQRDDLLKACKKLLRVYDPYDVDEQFVTERLAIQKYAETAIAKCKD